MSVFHQPVDLDLAAQDVPVEAGSVRWRCVGDGPPAVLLHGGHGSWAHWARNVPALSAHRTLWLPDMPGYGDSTLAPDGFEGLLAQLRSSLDTLLGPETDVDLLGFSFGGLVASHLAARRGHLRSLTLVGAAGHGSPRRPRGELKSWREAQVSGDSEALQTIMRHNLWVHMLHSQEAIDHEALRIHTQACMATRFRSKSISLSGDLMPPLQTITAPVLLLWGEHDVTATPELALQRLLAPGTDRRGYVLPDTGHWAAYENPETVNRHILAFWNTLDAQTHALA